MRRDFNWFGGIFGIILMLQVAFAAFIICGGTFLCWLLYSYLLKNGMI
jgi:hypothetical protein